MTATDSGPDSKLDGQRSLTTQESHTSMKSRGTRPPTEIGIYLTFTCRNAACGSR
nr:MAG TPA: hypothetical protein [Caudoviricetes sp.]